MGLFDGWGNMGGAEDALAQPPGLLDNIGTWLKDPRNAAGLQAFGAALAKAGAPTREPKGSFAGGLSEALSGFTQGQQGFDEQKLKKMMQDLQMQTASLQQKKLQGEVDGTGAYTLPAGAVRMQGGQVIGEAPFKPLPEPKPQKSPLELAISMRESLPIGSPQRQIWDDQIRKLNFIAKDAGTTVINQPAPTMTEILDPTDPTRMLRVNAREYSGGSLGSKGVLGVSGKEPTAAKKAEQVDSGRQTVTDLVTELNSKYDSLEKAGGITNTKNGTLSNIKAGISSSGVGQAAGKLVGTATQSDRNAIAQTRPLLLQAIKQATGMSAKQMDSNVELKMYLAAATDPSLDVQSNRNALRMLEKLYGIGGGAGASSSVDDLVNKYRSK